MHFRRVAIPPPSNVTFSHKPLVCTCWFHRTGGSLSLEREKERKKERYCAPYTGILYTRQRSNKSRHWRVTGRCHLSPPSLHSFLHFVTFQSRYFSVVRQTRPGLSSRVTRYEYKKSHSRGERAYIRISRVYNPVYWLGQVKQQDPLRERTTLVKNEQLTNLQIFRNEKFPRASRFLLLINKFDKGRK